MFVPARMIISVDQLHANCNGFFITYTHTKNLDDLVRQDSTINAFHLIVNATKNTNMNALLILVNVIPFANSV